MVQATPLELACILAIFLVGGFFYGMDFQSYRNRKVRAKLEVAEAALVDLKKQLDRLRVGKVLTTKKPANDRMEDVR